MKRVYKFYKDVHKLTFQEEESYEDSDESQHDYEEVIPQREEGKQKEIHCFLRPWKHVFKIFCFKITMKS